MLRLKDGSVGFAMSGFLVLGFAGFKDGNVGVCSVTNLGKC